MGDLDPFHKNIGDMLAASQRCLQVRQHLPALVLMYTLIDSLAWAASFGSKEGVRQRFESWASTWLIPKLAPLAMSVTATDLYGGRCAVLHTLTGESDLSVSGHARKILYAWGTGKIEILDTAIRQSGKSEYVALHYDDLFTALLSAVELFLDRANNDPSLSSRLEQAAAQHYMNINAGAN